MKKQQIITLIITLFLTLSSQSNAASVSSVGKIQVVGLFKNAAILQINDVRKMFRVGDNKAGIELYEANSERAKIKVAGKVMVLSMAENMPVKVGLPGGSDIQAHLLSSGGMFNVTGSINAKVTEFVVDTGATYVTISSAYAKRLQIDYSKAKKLMMNTANGKATAYIVTVKSVRIGGIEIKNVKTAVMHGLSSKKVLLGMSFLSQVEMTQKNGVMVLKKRG